MNIEAGTIYFECKASDLWELVLELVNDKIEEDRQRKDDFMLGIFETMNINTTSINAPVPHEDRPTTPHVEHRYDFPMSDQNLVLRQIWGEELDRMRVERIKEEARPRSRWNKAGILENCIKIGIHDNSVEALRRMTLKDVLESYLIYVSTDITGNEYDSTKQRHTKFYRLD